MIGEEKEKKRRGRNVLRFAKNPHSFFLRIFLGWKRVKEADEEEEE